MALLNITNFFPPSFLSDSSVQNPLGEEFALSEIGNIVFHWADFHETCEVVKNRMETDPEIMEDFRRREAGLARLASIPIWIKTQTRVEQTTMFNLYEKYLLNHAQFMRTDEASDIEISFISGTGPFKPMAISECFNKSTYKDFVLVYLLKGKLPQRDYRIRLKSKILMEYGKNFEGAQLVNLEQLSVRGLLLSIDTDFFNKNLSLDSKLRLLIDTQSLKNACGKSLQGLQTYLSQYAFNLMYSSRKEDALECEVGTFSIQASCDFIKTRKVYLFASYNNLVSSNSQCIENIKDFVNYSRELVREHYEELSVKQKLA